MPGALLLFLALLAGHPRQERLTLEIRTYRGTEDVSEVTRVMVHRAGEREQPVGQIMPGGRRTLGVDPGIYDAQAVHERDGRVLNIRWAERLIVMPYPDEAGHHLEVINFVGGFGALQVREPAGGAPGSNADVSLFTAHDHARPAAMPTTPGPYALFVVRAGQYDVFVRRGSTARWHTGVDVPLDRTRLWIVP
jgi:hypothetical protein